MDFIYVEMRHEPALRIKLTGFRILLRLPHSFLARLQNYEKDYRLRHLCSSVRLSAYNNSAPTGRILTKFDI